MSEQQGIFSRANWMMTAGIIITITAVAFEGLAVTTVAPVLARDLQGLGLYGWVFSSYMLAQLVGTIIAGQQVDRNGPAYPFAGALAIFSFGLLIAAIAPNMPVLIVGRALQGLGAGAAVTCIYTSITLKYEDSIRPRILAVFSAAYILPALIGPYFAGVIAEHFSWRLVFWGLMPLILVAAALTLPAFWRMQTHHLATQPTSQQTEPENRYLPAIQLAIGTGLLLTGLGRLPQIQAVALSVLGLLLVIWPIRQLLPIGTFVASGGLSAIVAARGLFVASYFGSETFLVLALTTLKGYAADTAGLVLVFGALSWSAAAWLQARLDRQDHGQHRRSRVLIGIMLMLLGVGIAAQIVWLTQGELVLAIIGQILSGFGIGLAHPTSGAVAFTYTNQRAGGTISTDLQVADSFTPAVGIGLGGALIAITHAAGWQTSFGVAAALGIMFLLVLVSLLAAFRMPTTVNMN